jgi:ADP-ribose pyrophosphatase YjhB (NUDIX family)
MNNPIDKKIILTQPRIGSAAVVIKDNKILLGIRAKEPNKGKWVLPGGKIKLFETIKEAVSRELLEETGLQCEIGKQIGVYEIIDNPNEHRIIIYNWAYSVRGNLKPSSDISELKFFSKEELHSLELTPIVKRVLQDIGWL